MYLRQIEFENIIVPNYLYMVLKAASHLTENSATKGNEWEN